MLRNPNISRPVCAAIILFSAFAAPSVAVAKSCKSWAFIGQASAANKSGARAQARTDWKNNANAYWGFQWSNWSIVASKWQHCDRNGRGWSCRASAIPCSAAGGFKQK